jgi:hypothetical protein
MLIANLRSTPAVATGRVCLVAAAGLLTVLPLTAQEKPPQGRLRIDAPPIATDKSIKYDYDIVYVRAPRYVTGKDGKQRQAEVWTASGNCVLPPRWPHLPEESSPSRSRIARGTLAVSSERFR